ncbi:MAG: pyruvate formate lyase family protein, partial [Actinomycetota bacterium]|nr:pyruvate formate lyase family protein [Actinomycetota bacterium]
MEATKLEVKKLLEEDSPRIERLKNRLLTAPYEICLSRAREFTRAYRETEGLHPALRNAIALKYTCENQPVHIYEDEWIVGSKTDKYLSPVVAPERGDSLRSLQEELYNLDQKERPFGMSPEEKKVFLKEILPYWEGKSLRDRKGRYWIESGIIEKVRVNPFRTIRQIKDFLTFAKHAGRENLNIMAGIRPNQKKSIKNSIKSISVAWKIRDEISKNNPNMGLYCYDVQGHLHLPVEKIVREGFLGIKEKAEAKLETLDKSDPEYEEKKAFLEAVMISMDAACTYADRFRMMALKESGKTSNPDERSRLLRIAESLEYAPARPSRTFREGIQATWFGLLIGEIQYGMHDVLGIGRADQYLYPLFKKDMENDTLTVEEALDLLEELNLKLTANISLFPEVACEANGTLGVSQHCLIIGGVDADGNDATNELSYLMLDAYERMHGAINQLSVRIHDGSPPDFLRRAIEVFRKASGHAFFNDDVIIPALMDHGVSERDARDYNVVGCIETSTGGNCFPCPGGNEVVLPLVLYMTMTNGKLPAPIFGQKRGMKTGKPDSFKTFEDFLEAFKRQLEHQIETLVKAIRCKDQAYMDFLPAPYISAFIDGCIENAKDATQGGAKYDFTSVIGRGLGTCVDSLLAIKEFVYDKKQ